MVKMIIVEDETILRQGIYKVGNWQAHGVQVIGLAENGQEALKIMEADKPDIILTDVVMPVMGGIELTKYVYENFPDIRVVILSGHEEFQYVKDAIEYRASNYLLKPAKIEQILEVVLKLKGEIEAEREKQQEEQLLREKLQESIPVLRDYYLNRLVSQGEKEPNQLEKQFQFLSIPLQMENLVVLVAESDRGINHQSIGSEEEYLLHLAIKAVCEEVLQGEYRCYMFADMSGRIVVLLNYKKNMPFRDTLKYISGKGLRIQKEMKARYGRSISIGISRPVSFVGRVNKGYKEGVQALSYKFFMGNQSLIYIGDIDVADNDSAEDFTALEKQLLLSIRSGNEDEANAFVEQYFMALLRQGKRDKDTILHEIVTFVGNISRGLKQEDGEKELFYLRKLQNLLKDLWKNEGVTIDYLQQQVIAEINKVVASISHNRQSRNRGLIENAKDYIKNNLSNEVSLITVSDALFISPNYLSFLFKESGENFKEYLIRMKMERAEQLIQEGKYNLNQIAYEIGYRDGRYFSQIYKKYTGKNPESKI